MVNLQCLKTPLTSRAQGLKSCVYKADVKSNKFPWKKKLKGKQSLCQTGSWKMAFDPRLCIHRSTCYRQLSNFKGILLQEKKKIPHLSLKRFCSPKINLQAPSGSLHGRVLIKESTLSPPPALPFCPLLLLVLSVCNLPLWHGEIRQQKEQKMANKTSHRVGCSENEPCYPTRLFYIEVDSCSAFHVWLGNWFSSLPLALHRTRTIRVRSIMRTMGHGHYGGPIISIVVR